ncbi:dihydrofolate synthase/folylpolyglutamate synthase [Aequitasia blattaphilus]|uniref:tetrahydrofolate synthase n=1 Tax=Aequitasia blattaphilus TaxID=2949332 RepID=A0ABT1EAE2_9FIRM|nr:folylpolyglutamate synthase/dihydrofolate synthase family protein [Aequitasia blattaphilus]MCP1102815.1 bifunctional folylpolyglutamate synthase/dihydrofolate synthase [Aequitasia blattaphilus]MCR8615455.1 bifunctional folylpolyglutamate synthase/dihydrofolate synthase [Aequitasia blattaphilus]
MMEFMDRLAKKGSILGLEGIRRLLEELGNPQERLQIVHGAGTNGKGSVFAFMDQILRDAGYKVGRYISPVVFGECESFQINGEWITEKEREKYLRQIEDAVHRIRNRNEEEPTVFEVETAVSFLYFMENACDLVLLETGLGGASDATNIVENTLLAVFTSISFDHMSILGNTLEEIGKVKAGIIKEKSLIVSAPQRDEVKSILIEEGRKKGKHVTFVNEKAVDILRQDVDEQVFSYGEYQNLKIAMGGVYQVENALLAIEGIKALQELGYKVSEEAIRSGLRKAQWIGRFSILQKEPIFIVDGAHNPDGAKKLAKSLNLYFTNKRIIYIMGVLEDKEYKKILKHTLPLASELILLTPANSRGLDKDILKRAAEEIRHDLPIYMAESGIDAVNISLNHGNSQDVIVAFGSLSYLGEIVEFFRMKK